MNNDSMRIGAILVTGISASGKTTLGKRLEEDLIKSGIGNVKRIEGEDLRKQLAEQGEYYGYSADERKALGPRLAKMVLEYNRKGFICIVCGIYHIRAKREEARRIIGNVMEVYLDCPVSICAQRDYKGQYAKAFQGLLPDFIGVTEPYQKSEHVDLVLHTGRDSIERCSELLLAAVMGFLKGEEQKIDQPAAPVEDTIGADK